MASLNVVNADAALLSPFGKRTAEIFHFGKVAAELVIKSVWTYCPLVLADGHNVYALSLAESQSPVVLRHTGHDVLFGERPVGADEGVLHPYIAIVLVPLNLYVRVLHEHGRMRLAVVMHNLALVADEILDGKH